MWNNADISKAEYSRDMDRLVTQYNNLIRKAEYANRDNNGEVSRKEAEYYDQAAQTCDQIMHMNLSQRATYSKWQSRKNECKRRISEIADILAPRPAVPQTPKQAPASEDSTPNEPSTPSTPPTPTPSSSTPSGEQKKAAQAKTKSGFVTKNACDDVKAETIEKWHKDKPLQNFAEMSGMQDLKQRLMEEVAQMGWNRVDDRLKIKPGQRYFFYGPPGTGKTTIIRAFAHEMMERDENFHFIQLKGGDIHASLVGVAEKTVEIAFQEAVDNEPCLIFIDEVENVCTSRGAQGAEGHATRLTVAFLQAIDTLIDTRKRVIFMGATNYPDRVDEAMMNRVKLVKVPLPDEAARAGFFTRVFEKLVLEDGFSAEDMAAETDNCSYRDLENIAEGVALKMRATIIEDYKVYDEDGKFDQNASDLAADQALAEGRIILTRAMFEDSLRTNPPSDKTGIRERLRAFEDRVKVLQSE